MELFFVTCLQKTVHFYTFFSNTPFPWESGQTGQYPPNYKTLMYAIRRRKDGAEGYSKVKGQGKAVMGVQKGVPETEVQLTPEFLGEGLVTSAGECIHRSRCRHLMYEENLCR
jgi:hypothetical protein